MSKGRRSQVARRPTAQSLGHTATGPERRPLDTVRYTLMRTVLGDTEQAKRRAVAPGTFFPADSISRARSPVVAVRASGRTNPRKTVSPFLNATFYKPELPQRAMVCARRHIRKEVLFALRRTNGKGARSRRSKVRC